MKKMTREIYTYTNTHTHTHQNKRKTLRSNCSDLQKKIYSML